MKRVQDLLNQKFLSGETEFRKLTKEDMPYYFLEWNIAVNQRLCLYYGFSSRDQTKPDNEKRVPLSELVGAINVCATTGQFNRSQFESVCSVAHSAGDCGYTVVGRCMQLLGIAHYNEDGRYFVVTDKTRALELVKEDD